MRKLLAATAAAACLVLSPLAFAGTAQAATAGPAGPQLSSCVSYQLKQVNGRWTLVPVSTGCTTSSTGTSGSSGGSTGTSTPGTVTNNCPLGGCYGSATGTAGRSR